MKKQLFSICIIAFVNCALRTAAEDKLKPDGDVQEIPLKDVWAYGMPGTRQIRELEPEIFDPKLRSHNVSEEARLDKKSLVLRIANYLASGDPQKPQPARPGFAVLGNDAQALREVHAILVEGREARQLFPPHSKLTLVFFSKLFDYGVGLDQVERQGNKITIRYFFAPIPVGPGSAQFALIPLGELPVGEMEVDMVRAPTPPKYNDPAYPAVEPKWDAIIVCHPFKFTIEKNP